MREEKFGDKHPIANTILGLVMLLFCVIVVFLVLRLILFGIIAGIVKIHRELSKMDAVVVVALITGAFSILAVCISTIIGKLIESHQLKRDYLTRQREEPYEDFVQMIYKLQTCAKLGQEYSEQEMLEDISRVSKQITLWGSNRVVDKWVSFRENSVTKENATNNLLILEDIMNDMRKDLGVGKVKKGNLLVFFVNDIKEVINNH